MKKDINKNDGFPTIEYREIFMCPYHGSRTDNGWCWECAEETYGYEEAKRIYDKVRGGK